MELACPICHRKLLAVPSYYCGNCGFQGKKKDGIYYLIPEEALRSSVYQMEIKRYNRVALDIKNYDGYNESNAKGRAMVMLDLLEKNNVKEYVNLGAGFGDLEKITTHLNVMVVDQSLEFLKIMKSISPKITCINGIAESLPFVDESVSCFIEESTFQSVQDRVKFLYEIGRVVQPGGLIILTIAYRWHYWNGSRRPQDGFDILIPREFNTLKFFISELGFECEYKFLNLKSLAWVDIKEPTEEADYLYIIGRKR